jgi:hypothetical protein
MPRPRLTSNSPLTYSPVQIRLKERVLIHAATASMNPAKKEHSMGIKTNEDWLLGLTAAGAEQEAALKDLRQRFPHTMRRYLRESHGGKPALDSEEARQLAEIVLRKPS